MKVAQLPLVVTGLIVLVILVSRKNHLTDYAVRRIMRCLKIHSVAGWSSQVARQTHNLEVVGSNPAPATNLLEIDGNEIPLVIL